MYAGLHPGPAAGDGMRRDAVGAGSTLGSVPRIAANWLDESRTPQPWIGRGGPGERAPENPSRDAQTSDAVARRRWMVPGIGRVTSGGDAGGVGAPRTSRPELVLLLACVIILPFDDALPLGPISWGWMAFAALGLFEILRHGSRVISVALSGPMLRMWLFLALALAFEAGHGSDSVLSWASVAQMAIALVFVAVAIRDPCAMCAVLYALVAGAVLVSLLSINGNYGTLSRVESAPSWQVSVERGEALRGTLIGRADINSAAGSAAIGATIALGLAMTARTQGRRALFALLTVLIAAGVTLTASRGAMITLVVGASAGLLVSRRRWLRGMVMVGLVVAVVLVFVPRSAFSRFEALQGQETQGEREDPRAQLWEATVDSAPNYLPLGVGVSDFAETWGRENGFAQRNPETGFVEVLGTHNAFTQILIWWGIPTLAAFCWFLAHLVSRAARKRVFPELRAVLLMAVAALLGQAMVAHTLQDKTYSMILGITLAYVLWFPESSPMFPSGTSGGEEGAVDGAVRSTSGFEALTTSASLR